MTGKYLLILFIALSSGVISQAQVRCGFIGGMNYSNLNSEEYSLPNMSGSSYGSFGAAFDITLSSGFSVYLSPMYVQKGAKLEITNPESVSANLNMSFFEMPLFVRYTFGNKLRPYLFTGPTLAVNIASNIETNIAGFALELDAQDMTSSVEFGLTLGTGLSFVTDEFTLFVEGRYSSGLTDIISSGTNSFSLFDNEIEDLSVQLPSFTSSGFQLLAGFALPFNGVE